MPLTPPMINAVDVLIFIPADAPWRERLHHALLRVPGATPDKVARHLDLLDRRQAGEFDWKAELGDAPGMPAARRYSAMLLHEDHLPLYTWGDLHWTLDLFNPNNEGADPAYDPQLIVLELLVHTRELYPRRSGTLHDGTPIVPSSPESYGQIARYGAQFGELAAWFVEALDPVFACADMVGLWAFMQTRLNPAATSNPAQAGSRYWDFLWSLSYWSPALLTDKLAVRLKRLEVTEQMRVKIDRFELQGICPTWRALTTGGLFVQYRYIFGVELRGTRATIDTPLAKQAGLRTTARRWRG